MSKKIIFTGNPYGCYQVFEPSPELPENQETPSAAPVTNAVKDKIEQLEKLSGKELKDFCNNLTENDWIGICSQNSNYLDHPASFPLRDEARQAFFLMEEFKKKNIRIGFRCAVNLCKLEADSCQITAFDIETALPVSMNISKDKADKILAPFQQERETVFGFLSSGDTQGILPEFMERNAEECPVKSKTDLENLIALCQPGALMYWDEYKSNSPCRLALAAEIPQITRGVLLYKEQQEQALQILTSCSAEDAAMFRKHNSGTKLDRESRESLINLIAAKQNISAEEAEEFYTRWHYYTASSMSKKTAQQAAFKIYKQALEQCRI